MKKENKIGNVLFVVCIILLVSLSGSAVVATNLGQSGNTYYVDQNNPNASDSNPGTEDLPWLTIQKAANMMVAGDMVYIKTGIYNERVMPQNSGGDGNYITYAAYPNDTVTIDGSNINLKVDHGVFEIKNKSYITISGLRVKNSDANGIIGRHGSSHLVIERNHIQNCKGPGIAAGYDGGANNITAIGNEVVECSLRSREAISFRNVDTFEIKNNYVHDTWKEGIDAKSGCVNGKIYNNYVYSCGLGIYLDAGYEEYISQHDIDVYQNVVCDCIGSFAVSSEAGALGENIRIYNNIAYDSLNPQFPFESEGDGLTIASYGVSGPLRNISVINNVFYGKGHRGIYVQNNNIKNVVIRNNICSQNDMEQILVNESVDLENVVIDHNLIDGSTQIYGDEYVIGDPMFVNPYSENFHIQKNSPAIDNGSSLDAPNTDFDGNERPYGNGYDIGAFEYQGNVNQGLRCSGVLSWVDVKPGSTKTGSFTVENVGDPGLGINWSITEWPSWGTWTFTPSSGDNLSPEDGPVTVDVSVVAPDEQNKDFGGMVKIVNKNDSSDFCIIPVSLTTPKNRVIPPIFIQFLERLIEHFPFLERLLDWLIATK